MCHNTLESCKVLFLHTGLQRGDEREEKEGGRELGRELGRTIARGVNPFICMRVLAICLSINATQAALSAEPTNAASHTLRNATPPSRGSQSSSNMYANATSQVRDSMVSSQSFSNVYGVPAHGAGVQQGQTRSPRSPRLQIGQLSFHGEVCRPIPGSAHPAPCAPVVDRTCKPYSTLSFRSLWADTRAGRDGAHRGDSTTQPKAQAK